MSDTLMMDRKTLRFAAYVRGADIVSSYETLLRKYKEIIQQRNLADPETFSFVRFYSDEGKSYEDLDRLIADCRAGEIDFIICDCMKHFGKTARKMIQHIKELSELDKPVGVWFEEPKVFTLSKDGQLMMRIFEAIVEEESRQRSIRMKEYYRMKKDVNHE